jgi:hypothetical protein
VADPEIGYVEEHIAGPGAPPTWFAVAKEALKIRQ